MPILINLTPHTVTVLNQEREVVVHFPPSGQVARVVESPMAEGFIPLAEGEVSVIYVETGTVVDLPEPRDGVLYIVSRPAALAMIGKRDDLLVPNDFVRDEKGSIIGCQSFAIFKN